MKSQNKYLYVKFDPSHNKVFNVGGLELIRPDDWLHADEYGKQTFAENTNYLETKPQICTVLASNDNYPYQVGDVLFTHYMSWETAQNGDISTNEAFIIADYVFFTILPDGSYKMADGVYIGEQVYTSDTITEHGVIAELGGKKEALRVKITHIPDKLPKWHTEHPVKVGDIAISVDKYNYEFTIYPKRYIKLTEQEIAGVLIDADAETA